MPLIPVAAFLVGALLSVLMPLSLLIALVIWYWLFATGVPDTQEGDVPSAAALRGPVPGMGNPAASGAAPGEPDPGAPHGAPR